MPANEIKNSNTDETLIMRSGDGLSSSASSNIKLSKGEIEDLREAFRLFDVESKGVVSFNELKEVADSLALEHGNKQNPLSSHSFRHLSDMLCSVTNNKNNDEDMELDEEAFVRLLSERYEDDTRDEYQRVFDLFDRKGKGHIDIRDLRKIAEELGETMEEEELEEMIAKATKNGKVTPEDFQRIMTKRLFS